MQTLTLHDAGPVVFASDFHLRGEDRLLLDSALGFFTGLTGRAGTLVLLGDIFDLWIGPKSATSWFARAVLEALRALSDSGVRVLFVPGNRDFLLDQKTAAPFGIEVLGETVVLVTQGRRLLCLHGDQLCVRDRSYRIATRFLRSTPVRNLVCRLPEGVSRYLARGYRDHSRRITRVKTRQTMDLCFDVVDEMFSGELDGLVCGHVHDPRHYRSTDPAIRKDVVVLSTWNPARNPGCPGIAAVLQDGEISLEPYRPSGDTGAGGSPPRRNGARAAIREGIDHGV